ncbi:Protein CBR-SRR-6 [Caenorhabditis briggsae]|uniref:Protein CBR-SRR-6 n=2 Tax=Caenorhabditis briggsae TaxID=6238 RepID=A8X6X0_CAEBR|nr:Protein CBR-SRR-6 [Caenorhabditis briggsae]CAP28381.1 Protein CBR-SRR-6 [Caenorhabditis briggsae]
MINPSTESMEDETNRSRTSSVIMPEVKEPLLEENLVGPFRKTIKITGLDCRVIALAQNNPNLRIRSIITRIVALAVIALIFFRCGMIFKAEGPAMSLTWAESNMFAFMGIHAIVCAFCIFGWSKNEFVPLHISRLNKVRALRVKESREIDDYSSVHRKAFIWSAFWFLALLSHAIASAATHKILISGKPVIAPLYIAMPFLTLLSCFIVTHCLIYYFLVHVSLKREIEYFNVELDEAKQEKRLHDPITLMDFSHRQAELFRLVAKANESLGSYVQVAPMFCFNSCINAVYIASGFTDDLPSVFFAILLFNLFAVLAISFMTLRPAGNVQFHLGDTARVLMDSEEFEKSVDSEVFKGYQVMINRSLKHNVYIRVLGAIPIYPTAVNLAMFLFPNLGNLLALVKKVLVNHGVQV